MAAFLASVLVSASFMILAVVYPDQVRQGWGSSLTLAKRIRFWAFTLVFFSMPVAFYGWSTLVLAKGVTGVGLGWFGSSTNNEQGLPLVFAGVGMMIMTVPLAVILYEAISIASGAKLRVVGATIPTALLLAGPLQVLSVAEESEAGMIAYAFGIPLFAVLGTFALLKVSTKSRLELSYAIAIEPRTAPGGEASST